MTTRIIDSSIIIPQAKTFLRILTKDLFLNRDLAHSEEDIATAAKMMIGLEALAQDIQFTQSIDRQRILVVLNKICNVGQPQMAPTE